MTGKILALAIALVVASASASAVQIGVGTKNFTPPPGTPSYLIGEDGTPTARHFAPPAPRPILASPVFRADVRAAAAPTRRQVRQTTYRVKRLAKSRHVRHVATKRRVAHLVRHRVVRHMVRHTTRRVVHRTKVARPRVLHRRVAG